MSACGPADGDGERKPWAGRPESRCLGAPSLQDVQTYDGTLGVPKSFVNRHRLPVGLIRWRDDLASRYSNPGNLSSLPWCTGTLIDRDLLLTAGHCVRSEDGDNALVPRTNGTETRISRETLARELVVDFRFETSASTGMEGFRERVRVVDLVEYHEEDNGTLDYAILKLEDSVGDRFGVARISPEDSAAHQTIAILQHAEGKPLRVGVGAVMSVEPSRILYADLDTMSGSSGAGIIEVATGRLVGIHTHGNCDKIDSETVQANFGVPIQKLIEISPTIRERVDRSEDLVVGDWDGDGLSNFALRRGPYVHMDTNFDATGDLRQSLGDGGWVDEYLVGDWDGDGRSNIAIRRGPCVEMDTNFDHDADQGQCFGDGNAADQYLVGDWDGDGRSNLGVRRGNHVYLDTNFDSTYDRDYVIGDGLEEDEYLVGNWDGVGGDDIAYRRGNTVFMDTNGDGMPDIIQVYGNGGSESQYLAGDWNDAHRTHLAIRKGTTVYMNFKFDGAWDNLQTYGGR